MQPCSSWRFNIRVAQSHFRHDAFIFMSSTPNSRKRFSLHTLTRRFKSTSSLKGEKQTPKLGLIAEAHKTTSKLTVIEATVTQEIEESKDSQDELVFAKPVEEEPEGQPQEEQANAVVIDLTQPTPSFALDASRVLIEPVPSIIVEEEATAATQEPSLTATEAQGKYNSLRELSTRGSTSFLGSDAVEATVSCDDSSQRKSQGSATSTVVDEPRKDNATTVIILHAHRVADR